MTCESAEMMIPSIPSPRLSVAALQHDEGVVLVGMRVQPVLAAGGVDLERRPHVVGPRERGIGAPLIEQLGAHLEERRLLRRRLGVGARAAACVLIGCLHEPLLRLRARPGSTGARNTTMLD